MTEIEALNQIIHELQEIKNLLHQILIELRSQE